MSNIRHLHYGSIPNFLNLYKEVARLARRKLTDAEITSIEEMTSEEKQVFFTNLNAEMPVIAFRGSEKLHGENMAVCYSNGEMWVQGRNQIRTVLGDQNGMAAFVEERKSILLDIFLEIEHKHEFTTEDRTIVLDCEWAGGNIQKGNAACSGTDKGAYLFDFARVISNEDDHIIQHLSTEGLGAKDNFIYRLSDFAPQYSLTLDFSKPEGCEKQLKDIALQIEENSPIAAYFNKPDNVGEDAVLIALYNGNFLRLKTKGDKHGGKPKQPKTQSKRTPGEQALLESVADKVTPVWRLTQAIAESRATEKKHIGDVIKWVLADVVKEDLHVLQEAKLTIKQVSGEISKIVKDYCFDNLKDY